MSWGEDTRLPSIEATRSLFIDDTTLNRKEESKRFGGTLRFVTPPSLHSRP
jgi:hypothetical protein